MPDNKPNAKDLTSTTKLSVKKAEFVKKLRDMVAEDDSNRQTWKHKMVIATNQRLGVRRYSNTPYAGAPNIPLPETDKLIKKSVPTLVLSSTAVKKPARVRLSDGVAETPVLKEKVRKSEMGLNLILRSKRIGLFKKLLLAADFAKSHGHCIFRVVEDFRSRVIHKTIDLDDYDPLLIAELKAMPKANLRLVIADREDLDLEDDDDKEVVEDIIDQFKSGETIIEFDVERIVSLPNIETPLPTKIIVPSYTTNIENANRVTYEYFMTRKQLEDKMRDETFREKDIDKLDFSGVTKGDDSDIVEQQKRRNEGVTEGTATSDLFRIHETLCWYKPKKSGPYKRWVYTSFADVLDSEEGLLQDISFPFEFTEDEWNYDKYDNEVKDPRYYNSRGVPEQIRAIQEILERAVNNMLIRDEMNNTPMWEVLDSSEILDGHTTFGPGKMLPVQQIGTEIKQINQPNTVDLSSDRIMQLLKATAEEYLGNVDQLFRNATNVGGGKTLGEIREGVKQTSGPLNVEVINWNLTLGNVYQKVFDILKDRLDESIFIDGEEITKEDFNFPAEVSSNGNLEVSDKQMAKDSALFRLNTIAQFMQVGVVDGNDVYNALQDWLEKDGIKDPDKFSTNPEEIMQTKLAQLQQVVQQLEQQAQMLQQGIQEGNKDLAKIQEQGKKVVAQTAGKLEVNKGGR